MKRACKDIIATYYCPTFYSYFEESFNGEYHMYQFIPLHSCDYLKIKTW